jgi:hypothetical protein
MQHSGVFPHRFRRRGTPGVHEVSGGRDLAVALGLDAYAAA